MNQLPRASIVVGTLMLSSLLVMFASAGPLSASTENKSSIDNGGQDQLRSSTNTQDRSDAETEIKLERSQSNHPPKADAGNNKIVTESENVKLDGSGSSDQDGDKLRYTWELISPNLEVKLDGPNSPEPSLIAPILDSARNRMTLVFKLTVTDGNYKASDTVRITVTQQDTGNNKGDNNKIRTLTIIDTGEQPSKNQFFASDLCGLGTYAYSYLVPGVKWKTFPVTFAIDAANSHIDINAAKTAVRKAFATIDAVNRPPGIFFQETSNYAAAKIKFTWKYIDGPFNKLGSTTFSYRTDTKALISATVTLDSGDNYFVSSTERCGASGNQFDIQNIAIHEIGHAINLGHVSDRLQTMYPTSLAGETLKRTIGSGDHKGITNLYS